MIPRLFIFATIGVVIAIFVTGYLHGILLDVEWESSLFEGLDGITSNHLGHYKNAVQAISNLTAAAVEDRILSLSFHVWDIL